jgi:hydrogenase-4 membrane subunit HyfE
MKQLFFTLFVLLCALAVQAQGDAGQDPHAGLRAGGKIYVVLAVAVTILVGLLLYVIRLDRKITKLEKKL